ncbi:MAG: ribonuclease HII [uncultured bacterium]|nr:MAG: ribonuclease HII [uncultured bacterium]
MSKKKRAITNKERYRIKKLHKIESELHLNGYKHIAGVDEAGRGPLAGPVVAAACILPEKFYVKGINDSKKISQEVRERIYDKLIGQKDVIYSIAIVESLIIDRINIHQASLLAMKNAVELLIIKPDYLLFDGCQNPLMPIAFSAIPKGDALCISIAAASIIAKVTRDRIMNDYHKKYPFYGFDEHKGYGTLKHRKALMQYGPCPIHRKSFDPVKVLS